MIERRLVSRRGPRIQGGGIRAGIETKAPRTARQPARRFRQRLGERRVPCQWRRGPCQHVGGCGFARYRRSRDEAALGAVVVDAHQRHIEFRSRHEGLGQSACHDFRERAIRYRGTRVEIVEVIAREEHIGIGERRPVPGDLLCAVPGPGHAGSVVGKPVARCAAMAAAIGSAFHGAAAVATQGIPVAATWTRAPLRGARGDVEAGTGQRRAGRLAVQPAGRIARHQVNAPLTRAVRRRTGPAAEVGFARITGRPVRSNRSVVAQRIVVLGNGYGDTGGVGAVENQREQRPSGDRHRRAIQPGLVHVGAAAPGQKSQGKQRHDARRHRGGSLLHDEGTTK